jgi:RimJ/RimL family protein N-acetyltransferase
MLASTSGPEHQRAEGAGERGAQRLEWSTQPENKTAQRLYDRTGAKRSKWVEYELPL